MNFLNNVGVWLQDLATVLLFMLIVALFFAGLLFLSCDQVQDVRYPWNKLRGKSAL